MSDDVSSKSVLIYDYGLFSSLAELLVGKFSRVGYFRPWEDSFPDGSQLMVGQGLEGVERVKYFDRDVDSFDLLVFPWVADGWLVKRLRKEGYRVWGSGPASELELLRWKTKERFELSGVPVNDSVRVMGTSKLREFFISHPSSEKWYVKVSGLRGLFDTWGARNYSEAKPVIDEFDFKYGPQSYVTAFIIDKCIPNTKEIGYDGLNIDGQFPDKGLWGIEKKDKSYFQVVQPYEDMPQDIIAVNDSLVPFLKESQYRNFFHTELRDGIPIDITCRHASPSGETMAVNISNLPDVLYHGAEGDLVQPDFEKQFACQLVLISEWAENDPVAVRFPESIRSSVKLYNHCRIDCGPDLGMLDWVIPTTSKMKQIGSVVAIGDSPQEASSLCKELARQVEGFQIEIHEDSLDESIEEMIDLTAA